MVGESWRIKSVRPIKFQQRAVASLKCLFLGKVLMMRIIASSLCLLMVTVGVMAGRGQTAYAVSDAEAANVFGAQCIRSGANSSSVCSGVCGWRQQQNFTNGSTGGSSYISTPCGAVSSCTSPSSFTGACGSS